MAYPRKRPRVLPRLAAVVASALLASAPCVAQSFTGSISGTVADSSGAVVPSAQVTITQTETNRQARVVAGNDGTYLAPALPVGDYRVEATAAGFKIGVRSGIKLELNQAAVINLTLDVGAATDRVEVKGDAELLESTTSDLGEVVDNRRILDLPLNTRNVFTLINLTPGTLGSSTSGMTARHGPSTAPAQT